MSNMNNDFLDDLYKIDFPVCPRCQNDWTNDQIESQKCDSCNLLIDYPQEEIILKFERGVIIWSINSNDCYYILYGNIYDLKGFTKIPKLPFTITEEKLESLLVLI